MNTNELNDGHIIEAVDRIHVANSYIIHVLMEHPLLNNEPFYDEIEKVTDILAKLYQDVGSFDTIEEMRKSLEEKD